MKDMKSILWLAIEDYSGLWEAVWQLRTYTPETADGVLIERAKTVLERLVADDFIRFYRCQEPYGQLCEVKDTEVSDILSNPRHWEEPAADAVSIRFGITSLGQEKYASLGPV
ncbi:hypothetical protein V1639_13080 [Pseudarthrobacter sp. J75]|uniref:hypothetical protein n=1 Tax=unclassified Pseudarthrobacter TaxID=2647000 RepID=UPI002E80A3EC|nr:MULTISPECIES: hypothetical protein [unclassified Pseudarthrobacter]MEE2523787.1 hypothetical protein [Pseudarthrobacter sp. J47]MEE2529953.1 hypothetical protein [Pseudarthrobacter sp. J75]